jgi:hypothetical protein
MIKGKKAGLEKDELVSLLFVLLILVIIIIAISIFTDKGKSAIEFIKNLFRFGR